MNKGPVKARFGATLIIVAASLACREFESGEALNRGSRARTEHRYDEAIAEYRRAVDIDPRYGAAYCAMADVLREVHRRNEAVEQYKKGVELEPDRYECRFWYGVTLVETGAYAEAAKQLRAATSLKPEDPWPNIYGGLALYETKDYKGAVELFDQAARICAPCIERVQDASTAYKYAQEHVH